MKFKQYINEVTLTEDNVVEFIKKNCMPYLKDWKNTGLFPDKPLYSGREAERSTNIILKNVRQDRKPTNTKPIVHNYLNNYFVDKFKIALRSKTIFAVGSVSTTLIYGEPFIIIPVGKYEIYWSPKVNDLYQFYVDMGLLISDGEPFFRDDSHEKVFYDGMNSYKKGDLKGAIKSRNEVMVYTKQVILLSEFYWDHFKSNL